MRVSPVIITAAARLAWLDVNMAHHDINSSLIGLGSVTYEKMMIAAAVAGVSTGTTTTKRPELSTEFFLIPESLPEKNGIASVASVVSIPAPNRTISIQQSPPRFPTDDSRVTMTNNVHQTILRQRSWALPLAALSASVMLLMAAFEIFVLLKVRFFFVFV